VVVVEVIEGAGEGEKERGREGGRKAGERREEDSIGRGTGDVVAVLACLRRRCCAVCSA
jgi:hypothetical protein